MIFFKGKKRNYGVNVTSREEEERSKSLQGDSWGARGAPEENTGKMNLSSFSFFLVFFHSFPLFSIVVIVRMCLDSFIFSLNLWLFTLCFVLSRLIYFLVLFFSFLPLSNVFSLLALFYFLYFLFLIFIFFVSFLYVLWSFSLYLNVSVSFFFFFYVHISFSLCLSICQQF